jgi:hypothetical protein
MESLYTIQQTTKRIRLFNALAGVLAYPAALSFAWLWLREGQHRGLLGFALIWLLVAGVSLRLYAQFLRWWHQDGIGHLKLRGAPRSGGLHERHTARYKAGASVSPRDANLQPYSGH